MNETTVSGSIAAGPAVGLGTQRRVQEEDSDDGTKAPDAPKAKEFGLWKNSVLAGAEQRDKKKSKKVSESKSEDRNEMDTPAVQSGLKKMAARHNNENWTKEQLADLGRRLAAVKTTRKNGYTEFNGIDKAIIRSKKVNELDCGSGQRQLKLAEENISEEQLLAKELARRLDLFMKGLDRELGKKSSDRGIQSKTEPSTGAMREDNKSIGPDMTDPYEQGWFSTYNDSNPYEKGTKEYQQWQNGQNERESQPNHYDESVTEQYDPATAIMWINQVSQLAHAVSQMSPEELVKLNDAYQSFYKVAGGAVAGGAATGIGGMFYSLMKDTLSAAKSKARVDTEEILTLKRQIVSIHKRLKNLKSEPAIAKYQAMLKQAYEVLAELESRQGNQVAEAGHYTGGGIDAEGYPKPSPFSCGIRAALGSDEQEDQKQVQDPEDHEEWQQGYEYGVKQRHNTTLAPKKSPPKRPRKEKPLDHEKLAAFFNQYAPGRNITTAFNQHVQNKKGKDEPGVAEGSEKEYHVINHRGTPTVVSPNGKMNKNFSSTSDAQQFAKKKNAEIGKKKDVAEGDQKQLSVQQLATISDEALDNAYHYGRSSPSNTFGWQANLKSAAYAKQMIDKGITDIEAISDAIHKGWNVTAKAFVQNPDQFDDTEKLKAAGKLEAKLQQREKLMNIGYAQLPDEEQEKDRVVARALLQALKGQQGVAEESKGLWANIHAKQNRIKHGSGERMRKPGSKGAPTNANFKSASKTESVEETTGDPKFDKMLKDITGKKVVAKQQKADTKQQSRDAFNNMFGGGNPADSLGIRKKGVSEDSDPCWDNYKQVGMKKKNGKKVPNCVPKEDVSEDAASVKYGVFSKGGSVGDQKWKNDPIKTFDNKEEAIAFAKHRRSSLSKGEKAYYRMSYVVKPIKNTTEKQVNEHGDPWEDPDYEPYGSGKETRSSEQIAKDRAEHAILSKKLGLSNKRDKDSMIGDMTKMLNHFMSQHSKKKDVAEASASSSRSRAGLAKLSKLKSMTLDQQKEYLQKQLEISDKRRQARDDKQRAEYDKKMALKSQLKDKDDSKKDVNEATGYKSQFPSAAPAIQYAKDKVKTFRDPDDGIEIWSMPDGGCDVVHTSNSNGRNHCIDNRGKKLGTIRPQKQIKETSNYGDLDEVAPPHEEKLVKKLKKEYPGHPEKAFATAWSIYNKKHGKK